MPRILNATVICQRHEISASRISERPDGRGRSGFAAAGAESLWLWVDDYDVSHRKEGREAGDGFGFKVEFWRNR